MRPDRSSPRAATAIGVVGLVGSIFVLAGSTAAHWTAPFFLAHAPWSAFHTLGADLGRVILLAGMAVLGVAFLLGRPGRSGRVLPARVTAAIWYLPLLLAPPVLSRDMYAYADQGWLTAHADPYRVGMGTQGPFAGLVDDFWRGTTSVYPPLALQVERGIVALGGGDPFATVLLMRLPVLLSLAVVAVLLPRLARTVPGSAGDVDRALWWALLNPITVVHLVGGGHNDAVMLALVVAACALATTRAGLVTGSIVAGLAMAAKQPGLLAAVIVPLIALPTASRARRALSTLGSVAIALATFAAVTWASGMGYGWLTGNGSPTKAQSQSPACLVSLVVAQVTGDPWEAVYRHVLVVAGVGLVVALVWCWCRCWRSPLLVGGLAFLAYAALGPGLQPWYLVPALVLLGCVRLGRRASTALAAWGAQVVVAQSLQEAWGMPTLLATGWSLPAALVAGWLAARLARRAVER